MKNLKAYWTFLICVLCYYHVWSFAKLRTITGNVKDVQAGTAASTGARFKMGPTTNAEGVL